MILMHDFCNTLTFLWKRVAMQGLNQTKCNSNHSSISYSDRLHDFSVTIPRCYKGGYANSFFPCTARVWNSLPIECFPLTYDLSGFFFFENKLRTNPGLLPHITEKQSV